DKKKKLLALAICLELGARAKDAIPTLVERLTDKEEDSDVRAETALALLRIDPGIGTLDLVRKNNPEQTVKALLPDIKNSDKKKRLLAVIICWDLGPPAKDAIPQLVERLTDKREDTNVRAEAAMALQQIGAWPATEAAVPKILDVIQNPEEPSLVRE